MPPYLQCWVSRFLQKWETPTFSSPNCAEATDAIFQVVDAIDDSESLCSTEGRCTLSTSIDFIQELQEDGAIDRPHSAHIPHFKHDSLGPRVVV